MGEVEDVQREPSESLSATEMAWMATDVGLEDDVYDEPARWYQHRAVIVVAHSVSVLCASALIIMAVAVWRADDGPARIPELAPLRAETPPLPPPPAPVVVAAATPEIEMEPEPVARPEPVAQSRPKLVRKAKRYSSRPARASSAVTRPLPALPKPPPPKRRFGHF